MYRKAEESPGHAGSSRQAHALVSSGLSFPSTGTGAQSQTLRRFQALISAGSKIHRQQSHSDPARCVERLGLDNPIFVPVRTVEKMESERGPLGQQAKPSLSV